jgi:hypothetical protein
MRIIETKDVAEIRPLYDAWLSISHGDDFGLDIDSKVADANVQYLIAAGGALFVAYDNDVPIGFLTVSLVPSAVGKQIVAMCTYWFALPSSDLVGPNLIEVAKKWTANKGCGHLLITGSKLASDSHDKICRYCNRIGAKQFETIYILGVA